MKKMKEMTVAELLKKKRALEETLNSCIDRFEVETGVKVSNICNYGKYIQSNLTAESIKVPDIHIFLDL